MILPLQSVVTLFSRGFTAYDITTSIVNGRRQHVQDPDRIIKGNIQPAGPKDVKTDYSGSISIGDLIIHTRFPVYFYDLEMAGPEAKQTYVRYQGETWKVNGVANWNDWNGGSDRYLLTKYTSVDDGNL